MTNRRRYDLVLAVHLTARGYGWVLFEGPHSPLDWGVVAIVRSKRASRCTVGVMKLIERYRPDCMILELIDTSQSDRTRQRFTITNHISAYIEGYGLPLFRYGRNDVRQTFAHLPHITKDTIAEEIARLVPSFMRLVPPRRRPWMGQHARMGLFEAAALVITHYGQRGTRTNADGRARRESGQ